MHLSIASSCTVSSSHPDLSSMSCGVTTKFRSSGPLNAMLRAGEKNREREREAHATLYEVLQSTVQYIQCRVSVCVRAGLRSHSSASGSGVGKPMKCSLRRSSKSGAGFSTDKIMLDTNGRLAETAVPHCGSFTSVPGKTFACSAACQACSREQTRSGTKAYMLLFQRYRGVHQNLQQTTKKQVNAFA